MLHSFDDNYRFVFVKSLRYHIRHIDNCIHSALQRFHGELIIRTREGFAMDSPL